MEKPLLRAEAIIMNEDYTQVLVQCDTDESFYRFPGGSIEFGETAHKAIIRELLEEYDLKVKVNDFAMINEYIFEIDGKKHHQCNIYHFCTLEGSLNRIIFHKEYRNIVLIWKKLNDLEKTPTYPEGIVEFLQSKDYKTLHLVTEKVYL
ncbi:MULTISPECIES: NUDIX domain-containing protein [Bacillus cereus group]|uniref:NUDIX domain-containing protein n=1 Tax=Bacillus cereus group TaxID=86661 RepID=UPI000C281B76|nr:MULTISPECIES: NUDIX domain-containing protein [Bacillus cereus group]MCC2359091.1 NUDIX domain-containing protein [Bacillus paranthracis]